MCKLSVIIFIIQIATLKLTLPLFKMMQFSFYSIGIGNPGGLINLVDLLFKLNCSLG